MTIVASHGLVVMAPSMSQRKRRVVTPDLVRAGGQRELRDRLVPVGPVLVAHVSQVVDQIAALLVHVVLHVFVHRAVVELAKVTEGGSVELKRLG